MRALVVRRYGPPEVFELRQVPDPQPKPAEVLIRVKAVGIIRAGTGNLRSGGESGRRTGPAQRLQRLEAGRRGDGAAALRRVRGVGQRTGGPGLQNSGGY